MGGSSVDRAFFEINSNAPDADKGFQNLAKTLGAVNESVIKAQKSFADTTNALNVQNQKVAEALANVTRLEQGMTNLGKETGAYCGVQKDLDSASKQLTKELEKQSDVAKKYELAQKQLAKANEQSGGSFQSLAQIISDFAAHPLQTAQSGLQGLISMAGPLAVGAVGIGGAFVTAGVGLYEFTKHAAEAAQSIKNLSYATGLGVESIQELQILGKERGLGDLAAGIERINIQLGKKEGGEFTEAILRMGIAIKQNADAIYYLEQMREHYAQLTKEIGANATAQQMAHDLGRRLVGEFGPLLMDADESITKSMDHIKNSGAVMTESQISDFVKTKRAMDEMGLKWDWLANKAKLAAEGIITGVGGIFLGGGETAAAIPSLGAPAASYSTLKPENIGLAGPNPSINDLRQRQDIIAQGKAMASGMNESLMPLEIKLKELEKQQEEIAKTAEKGLEFEDKKYLSISAQIGKVKELIEAKKKEHTEDEADQRKIAARYMEDIRKVEEDLKRIPKIQEEINTKQDIFNAKLHAGLIPEMPKNLGTKTLEELKNYNSISDSIAKTTEQSHVAELKFQEQLIMTTTPRNADERLMIAQKKESLEYEIKAEEIINRLAEEKRQIESRIATSKLSDSEKAILQARVDSLDDVRQRQLDENTMLHNARLIQLNQDAVQNKWGPIYNTLTNGIENSIVTGFQNAGQTLKSIGQSLFKDIFQMAIEPRIKDALSKAFGAVGGGGMMGISPMMGMMGMQGGPVSSQLQADIVAGKVDFDSLAISSVSKIQPAQSFLGLGRGTGAIAMAGAMMAGSFLLSDASYQGGTRGTIEGAVGGAMEGAASGFMVGTMIGAHGGPLGAAIGAGVGLIAGAMMGLFGGAEKRRKKELEYRQSEQEKRMQFGPQPINRTEAFGAEGAVEAVTGLTGKEIIYSAEFRAQALQVVNDAILCGGNPLADNIAFMARL